MQNPGESTESKCFSHLACFDSLSAEELDYIATNTRSLYFKSGETICKQGTYAPYVIFISEGLAKIYLEVTRDKQVSTQLAKPGDFISFSAVFRQDEYSTSAAALTDVSACMINREAITGLLKSNTDFAYKIISRNWQTENRLLGIISDLAHKQMAGKLATAIIYIADFAYPDIFNKLGRKDIAAFANISIESTVKILKEFASEDIISLSKKDIKITNRKALEKISKAG